MKRNNDQLKEDFEKRFYVIRFDGGSYFTQEYADPTPDEIYGFFEQALATREEEVLNEARLKISRMIICENELEFNKGLLEAVDVLDQLKK